MSSSYSTKNHECGSDLDVRGGWVAAGRSYLEVLFRALPWVSGYRMAI